MSIVDFLDTTRPRSELQIALEVLREFKRGENTEEYCATPFATWIKLEQLEEFLEYLVENKPLREDTVEYRARVRETDANQSG